MRSTLLSKENILSLCRRIIKDLGLLWTSEMDCEHRGSELDILRRYMFRFALINAVLVGFGFYYSTDILDSVIDYLPFPGGLMYALFSLLAAMLVHSFLWRKWKFPYLSFWSWPILDIGLPAYIHRLEDKKKESAEIVKGCRQLDDLLCRNLGEVVDFTEDSAVQIFDRVRQLDGMAGELLQYLIRADQQSISMQDQIEKNTRIIAKIAHFVKDLPNKISEERILIKQLLHEIVDLNSAVDLIQDVCDQTNLLSLNAAIEAAHAGQYGRGFAIVAEEIRKLSSKSKEAAKQIGHSIDKVQNTVKKKYGATHGAASDQEAEEAEKLIFLIQDLDDSYEDMRQFYKTLLRVVTAYNNNISQTIVNTLGSIQYQDVVRQKIGRLLQAVQNNSENLDRVLQELGNPESDVTCLHDCIDRTVEDYLREEEKHQAYSGEQEQPNAAPRIELF